jgi:hypothetical protein
MFPTIRRSTVVLERMTAFLRALRRG